MEQRKRSHQRIGAVLYSIDMPLRLVYFEGKEDGAHLPFQSTARI
jgi:hypothetical protein